MDGASRRGYVLRDESSSIRYCVPTSDYTASAYLHMYFVPRHDHDSSRLPYKAPSAIHSTGSNLAVLCNRRAIPILPPVTLRPFLASVTPLSSATDASFVQPTRQVIDKETLPSRLPCRTGPLLKNPLRDGLAPPKHRLRHHAVSGSSPGRDVGAHRTVRSGVLRPSFLFTARVQDRQWAAASPCPGECLGF